ncbi:MAG: phospholipid carrier-dependent glycosyltransferase, partial [Anaerolineales bacterium]|nr:phospholipid carrier-dependent glycosyltransferase [Anaerolineales bacterium]
MRRWLVGGCLVGILVVAAVLRMTGIDWDEYHHFHPDERYITWVATTIERPSSLATAFSPHQSTFNPYYWPPKAASAGIQVPQDEARDFAYGHLPLYLGVAATRLTERIGPGLAARLPDDWLLTQDVLNGSEQIEFRHLTAVSRFLTALFDIGTVLMIFLLGRRVYNAETGLLAAGLLAVNVMHIQLSHFFAFDPYMTFFVVTAVYFMVLAYQSAILLRSGGFGRNGFHSPAKASTRMVHVYLILAAICVGLAVGSKFAAVLLALPLALTVWLTVERRWMWLGTAVLIAAFTFFVTNPFAVLDLTCEVISPAMQIGPLSIPALDWRSCFLDNILTQGAMVRGDTDLPFTRQYIGTTPFLYFIEMQIKWGMGPLLGVAAFIGFGWAIRQTIMRL